MTWWPMQSPHPDSDEESVHEPTTCEADDGSEA